MKSWRSRTLTLVCAGLLFFACNLKQSDDDPAPGSNAGAAGVAAGSAGKDSAGNAGTAPGAAGEDGEAGSSSAGEGGTSGEAGADSGGDAGTSSGGTSGGSGGISGGGAGTGGTSTGGGGSGPIVDPGPGADPVPLWKEDFETGAVDWDITGGVWGVGAPTNAAGPAAFQGSKVAGTGLSLNYGVNNDAWIVTPPLNVPAAKDNPRFKIRYWYELAAGDAAYMYVRVVGGSWVNLGTLDQSGDGSWRQFMYSLKSRANQQVQFGFRLITNASAHSSGLFLDDARLEASGAMPFDPTEGFEADWNNWSAYSGVWAFGAPTAANGPKPFEGSKLAGTILSGDYGVNQDSWLTSPLIEVPAAALEPRITFKYWYELVSGDAGYVYIRVDGGSWTNLFTVDQSGDASWRSTTLSLAPYANRTVELGFRIITNASTFAPGFYVDDVRYETGDIPLSKAQGFENGFDGWSAYGGVWAVGKPTAVAGPAAHGGTALAGTILSGNYQVNNDSWLVSPRVKIPHETTAASVSYWYWYEFASGDAGYTYIRVDGGSWQNIDSIDQSGGNLWRQRTIDLTPYKDKTVEIGFRLITNASTFAPGFYVDDVTFKY